MTEPSKSSAVTWIVVGCGAAFVLLLCAGAGGMIFWTLTARRAATGLVPFTPVPGDSTAPSGSGGSGPQLPPPPVPAGPSDPSPRQIAAVVSTVTGSSGVTVGTECRFPVLRVPRDDGTFWCRAQATCGSVLLYGAGTGGYFNCQLWDTPRRDVVGRDVDTTSGDQDPSFDLDTRAGTMRIADDPSGRLGAFTIDARVIYVR